MAKRMTALDSVHQIGLYMLPNDDLMAVGGSSSVDPKKREIGDVISDSSIASDRTGK